MLIAAAVIVVLFVLVFATAAFWVNWWWFGSVGYRSMLTTRYAAWALSFLVGGALAGAFFAGNLVLAARWVRADAAATPSAGRATSGRAAFGRWLMLLPTVVATAVVVVAAGVASGDRWTTWLLFLRGDDFGVADPVFGRDVGFFVFAVPALSAARTGALAVVVVTALATAIAYAVRLGLNPLDVRRLPRRVRVHLLALGGLFLLLVAAGSLLANYELLYSTRGAVFGAGYTDVNVTRWANYALAAVTTAVAALLLLNAYTRRVRVLIGAVVAWGLLAVVLGVIVPAIVQQTVVEPNELRRERPYIEDNIAMTRTAFGLDPVDGRELSGQGVPDAAAVAAQPATFANVRLWDYRVIQSTYQNLRSLARYYRFVDVDVDRYEIDGQLRQVVVAARELDFSGLPANAQASWVNRHLVYTHGYGVVVSPAGEATAQGLPLYYTGGIPPEGTGSLAIERPEIYFGEHPADWVAVGSGEEEHTGLQDVTPPVRYDGAAAGSLRLDSYIRRVVAAVYLRDRRVLFSGELGDDARILLRREVVPRARTIAPFLSYDPDPYVVIADGHLYWIIDAYTETDRFPDATRVDGVNYIRNSVKVVVDAYDGTTTFYRTQTVDPIADAYGDIFSDLFTPVAEAPPAIAAHFRYPERLFDLQAEVFASYHVTDSGAFYNGEDRWAVAEEQIEGQNQRMRAYYVVSTLPGEQQPEFGLILPFTPVGRQNMTAWMAARLDGNGGGRLVSYRFPRQETIFGPQQIEARLNQDPDISRELTLLDQQGSRVIRGNLLVIPVGDAVLYVQPVYVQATATVEAPTELKFVVVASSERVVMRSTLAEALAVVTGAGTETADGGQATGGDEPPTDQSPGPPTTEATELAEQALAAFERGETALREGDWAVYGEEQAALEAILRELAGTGTPAAGTPEPATPEP